MTPKEPARVKLSNETLANLPETIARPVYDRGALSPGIVHIGLGNFHRAHQAWYLHRLMQQGEALDWAIIGAGVRPYDEAQRRRLAAQDHLTTLIELDPSGTRAEVIGPMIDYLPVTEGNGPLIDCMAAPEIRIVSLTVTEGGYYIDPAGGGLDTEHPDIRHDAAHPETPRTAFGAMVAALKRRRAAGLGAFAGQSCDNLQGNGAILRRTVVSLARLSDPGLADWIDANASFPDAMVDCIVPATGEKERALAAALGIDDLVPVSHENFRQWVIEDDFCAGRPDWDRAGAQFSDDVHGYEMQKIRILNAGHQIIAAPAEVLGIETIAEAMADARIRTLYRRVATQEIAPHVVPVAGMSPTEYIDLIERRFANPAIVDTVRRVAFDGSSRHPGFLLPTLRDALATGAPVEGLALVEALWARMCQGTREDGSRIAPNDPWWDSLTAVAETARTRPRAWLEMRRIYGDLADAGIFARAFETWLAKIWQDGVAPAIDGYLAR
ncbi:Mannitol dehydrogenase [Pseudooceanicola batsensis HTCC2597]|uniref:Mannitol dehydrogenase n=1 Tax=Pseudooceanicola batsensis (strain ATCC BAA-863 / DSM 15984 / KCTC 12145 / HTCC2597) TaxID=252305 RepID=A3TT66_PSEBH|nr:mannitol dehydrogenase family protein [Pseudooceanicola batsensis]EAQ04843.1 Mannitol dehydrogenase [Pseudooceanicola batsensis HTCC2597]